MTWKRSRAWPTTSSGVYEIGVTIDSPIFVVDDQAFDLHRLHDIWRAPLREVYP